MRAGESAYLVFPTYQQMEFGNEHKQQFFLDSASPSKNTLWDLHAIASKHPIQDLLEQFIWQVQKNQAVSEHS